MITEHLSNISRQLRHVTLCHTDHTRSTGSVLLYYLLLICRILQYVSIHWRSQVYNIRTFWVARKWYTNNFLFGSWFTFMRVPNRTVRFRFGHRVTKPDLNQTAATLDWSPPLPIDLSPMEEDKADSTTHGHVWTDDKLPEVPSLLDYEAKLDIVGTEATVFEEY